MDVNKYCLNQNQSCAQLLKLYLKNDRNFTIQFSCLPFKIISFRILDQWSDSPLKMETTEM